MARMERTSTPGIYRRGDRYVVVWRHRGKQRKEFFRTLAEAREAKGRRQSGERRPVSRIGFEDYFDGWIESYAGRTARGFSDTSRAEYRRGIETYALPRWGSWRLADVEPADVRELFADARRDGTSTAALRRLRASLSVMFATAVEDGLLRSNPISGVRIPAAVNDDPEDARPKALTRAELRMLLAAIPAERRLLFEFLAHTGMRIGEAVGLTWANLDLGERPRVHVREQFYKGERKPLKSGSGRRDVPLSPGMAAKLIAHRRDSYRGDRSPVFASASGRELYQANVSRDALKPAAESVGLGRITFHTFRHTCASLLFETGRNVKQVADWLGHADPSFTLRTYVHLMDDGIGDADFLDEVVGGSLPASHVGAYSRVE
jgi:integrase